MIQLCPLGVYEKKYLLIPINFIMKVFQIEADNAEPVTAILFIKFLLYVRGCVRYQGSKDIDMASFLPIGSLELQWGRSLCQHTITFLGTKDYHSNV